LHGETSSKFLGKREWLSFERELFSHSKKKCLPNSKRTILDTKYFIIRKRLLLYEILFVQVLDTQQVSLLYTFLKNLLDLFQISERKAKYWIRKYADPLFHPDSHKSVKYFKFNSITWNFLCTTLWDLLERFPLENIPFFQQQLLEVSFDVNYNDVREIFLSWNWSWKGTNHFYFNYYSICYGTNTEVYS
jgi:hypothetical protein